MKQSYKFGLLGLAMISSSAFAVDIADGWYAGLMGGATYQPSTALNIADLRIYPYDPPALLPLGRGTAKYGLGGGGGGQIGYRWCKFRFEGELYFNGNSFNSFTSRGFAIKKHLTPNLYRTASNDQFVTTYGLGALGPLPSNAARQVSLTVSGSTFMGAGLFNVFYDLFDEDADPTWVPYLGLGIGYAFIDNKLNINNYNLLTAYVLHSDLQTSTDSIKSSKSTPIGQAIVGLNYFFSDYSSLGLDYRFMGTKAVNFGRGVSSRVQLNTLNLVFNYTFSEA